MGLLAGKYAPLLGAGAAGCGCGVLSWQLKTRARGRSCTHSTEALAAGVNALPAVSCLELCHKEYVMPERTLLKLFPGHQKTLATSKTANKSTSGLLAASQIASIPVSRELGPLEEAFLI
jgi:hypothetical protein